jgi:hypothetical protein
MRSFSGGSGSSMRSSSGGNSGSSFRSFSGDGRSSSSRSFSGGGGNSSSSRSFSFGDSGSASSRTFSGGNSERTLRSFSGGNSSNSDRSVRTFSGGDNQSRSPGNSASNLSRILGNTSSGVGSNSSQRFQSPDNGSTRSSSGFAGSNRNGGTSDGQSSIGKSQNTSGKGDFRRNDGRNVDRTELGNFLDGGPNNRSPQLGNNTPNNDNVSSRGNSEKGNEPSNGRRLSSDSNVTNKSPAFPRNGRVSSDQVRDFLKLRGSDNARVSNNDKGNLGNIGSNNNSDTDPGNNGNLADRLNSRNSDGGRNFRNRGDLAGTDNNRFKPNDGANDRGDGPGGKGNDKDGPNFGKGDNDGNRWNDGKGRDGNNFRDGKNWGGKNFDGKNFDGKRWDGKDFRGKDGDRHAFNKWNDTWKGKDGKGRDHRDWSGKWRDGHRFETARHIRSHWWGRRDFDRFPFCGGWWGRGHGWGFWDTCAFSYNRPFFWWGWTTAPILTSWCDFGWSTPYYWDYGPGEYIYCNNGIVYVNGTWFEPAPVFYAQTLKTIDAAPVITEELAPQVEWLPLGVFAVTPDGLNEPNIMAQLAVTKDGVIGGTVFDQKLNKSFPVQGTIDKNTQRAMWSFTNDQNVRVIMETSVNNLTQNESTGLVHYGPNDQRVVEIVRLEDPSSGAKSTDATLPTPPQPTTPPQPQPVPPPVLPQ